LGYLLLLFNWLLSLADALLGWYILMPGLRLDWLLEGSKLCLSTEGDYFLQELLFFLLCMRDVSLLSEAEEVAICKFYFSVSGFR